MRRELTVAIAGAAIVVAGLSGCSSNKTGSASSSAKVTIDGQDQHIQGAVACNSVGGNLNIAIGGQAAGIGAQLTTDNPPQVKSVGLGNVNGVVLGYTAGTGQGNATATKNGNSYKISGTATGVNIADPLHPANKPFEIDVTCP